MAIHFLYDEVLEKNKTELQEILKEIKKDPDINKKIFILNSFTRSLIEVSKKIKEKPIEVKLKTSIMEFKPKPMPLKPLSPPTPSVITAPKPFVLPTPKSSNVIIVKEPQIVKQEQLEYITPTLISKTEIQKEQQKIKEEKPKVEVKKIELEKEPEKIKKIPLVVDKDNNEVIAFAQINGSYNLTEPPLDNNELLVLQDTKKEISGNPKKYIEQKENKLINYVKKYSSRNKVEYSESLYHRVKYYLIRDLINFGKIDVLLHDADISLIICNNLGPVNIKYKDQNLPTNITFKDSNEINTLIINIALKTGKKITEKDPFLDTNYQNFRIQATLATEYITPKFIFTRTL
jgi:hypothetical protein